MTIELFRRWTCSAFLSPSFSDSTRLLLPVSHVLDGLIWVFCSRISILMKLPGQHRINFRLQALISIPILRNNSQGNNQDNKVSQRMECGDIWILWAQWVHVKRRVRESIHFRRARVRLRKSHVFQMNTSMCVWCTWAKSFHHVTCVRVILTWDYLWSDQRRALLRLGGDLNAARHASFLSSAGVLGQFFGKLVTCCVYNIALSLHPHGCEEGIMDACCCLPLLPRVLETVHVCMCKVWANTNARSI